MDKNLEETMGTITDNFLTAAEIVSTERRHYDTAHPLLRKHSLEKAAVLAECALEALNNIRKIGERKED